MPTRGVVYDTGMTVDGMASRPVFNPDTVRREMAVIAGDLHADAVRIIGDDLDRLTTAAQAAFAAGLRVWFSPFPSGMKADELVPILGAAAERAETLRREGAVVLVLGCEMTLYNPGFLPGDRFSDRVPLLASANASPGLIDRANQQADDLHERLVRNARRVFGGAVTYAAGLWEEIGWRRYDRVSVNAYRDAGNAEQFAEVLRAYQRWDKPFSVTEFGCSTYLGAADRGPAGFLAIDLATDPPRLRPGIRRHEQEQAHYFSQVWDILAEESVDDAFWFSFALYNFVHRPDDPRYDLDTASFGLVAVTDEPHQEYPNLPWRPKAAFWALQRAFAAHRSRDGNERVQSPA